MSAYAVGYVSAASLCVATVLLAVALCVWPQSAKAQQRPPTSPSAEPVELRVDLNAIPDQRARAVLLATMRDAGAQGVPVEPLYGKIREGMAKGSPDDRIAEAVSQLAQRLMSAQTALAPARASDEIAAGAGALRQGVPVSALRALRAARPAQSLTVPLGVLTELVAYGVPTARATSQVRDLVRRGATNAQLVELSTNVQRDVAAGQPGARAFDSHAKRALALLVAPPSTSITAQPPVRPF